MPLWRDWAMMNRLHCTYSQLRAEPAAEMEVFYAFADGEAEARDAQKQQAKARS